MNERQFSEKDYQALVEALGALQSKVCIAVKRSYGGAYNIDFGIPSEKGAEMGSIYLRTHGTHFVVGDDFQIPIDTRIVDVEDTSIIEKINQTLNQFVGATVVETHVDQETLDLTIHMSSGIYIQVLSTDEDDAYEEIPYWSIIFDGINAIDVGPDKTIKFDIDATPS